MMNKMYEDFLDFVTFHYQTGRTDTEFWQDYQKPESITDNNRARRDKWRYSYPTREDFAADYTNRVFLTSSILVWMPMLCGMNILKKEHARALLSATKYMNLCRQNAQEYIKVREHICRNTVSQEDAITSIRHSVN